MSLDTLLNAFIGEFEGLTISVEGTMQDDIGESYSYVARVYNDTPYNATELNQKLRNYAENAGAYDRCGHQHDCCGCEFLSYARFVNEWPEDSGIMLYTENYGRNV